MLSKAPNTPLDTLTDEELVQQYAQFGDNRTFSILYERYVHLVFGSALKYMKSEEEAHDMVAQVFEKLYRKIPEIKEIQNFKGYLYRSVYNECIARLRQLKSEREKKDIYTLDEKSNNPFMENEGLIRLLDREESIEEQIEDAIEQLTPDQKRCIRLFFFDKKSYKEIGEIMNFSQKQVKSYLQNGKRNLRNLLENFIQKTS